MPMLDETETITTPNPLEQIPPHNRDAEMGLLGCMLLGDERICDIAIELMAPDDFYFPAHQTLFKIFTEVAKQYRDVDSIVAESELRRRGLLEAVGGEGILSALIEKTPGAFNVEKYARIVRELSVERKILALASKAILRIHRPGDFGNEDLGVLEEFESGITEIRAYQQGVTGEPRNLQEVAEGVAKDAFEKRGVPRGIQVGLADGAIQDLTGGVGLEPNKLIILAGRTSMGKTTFALALGQSVLNSNKEPGAPLIFSTEVDQDCMARACLAAQAGIHTNAFAKRNLTEMQEMAVENALNSRKLEGIYLDYRTGTSPARLKAIARRHQKRHGLPLLIVDLAGKLKGKGKDEREQLAYISAALSEIKGELNTTVIACVQLNRALFMSGDRRPELQHLKGSGSWEEDADRVWFLHRPGYYDGNDLRTEVIQAKDRDFGDAPKSVWIEWKKATGQFVRAEKCLDFGGKEKKDVP